MSLILTGVVVMGAFSSESESHCDLQNYNVHAVRYADRGATLTYSRGK